MTLKEYGLMIRTHNWLIELLIFHCESSSCQFLIVGLMIVV